MMGKRIVHGADGTWDSAVTHSNVKRLCDAIAPVPEQTVFYDDGIGADGNPVLGIVEGAFGLGIYGKVKKAYHDIAQVYQKDDELFLFGFSRGAFTARSLAGMIAVSGLPIGGDRSEDLVNAAFRAYRERDPARRKEKVAALNLYDAKIKMVGVWETVGSLGIPSVLGGVDPALYGFLDTKLHPDVKNAYHAVAIDESRQEFPPTLWQEPGALDQIVQQVWFCGVHSDVGGGERDVRDGALSLADITLTWMMDKASELDLQFKDDVRAQYESPLDSKFALCELHTSFGGIPIPRRIPDNAFLSNSVVIRFQSDSSWRPRALSVVEGELAQGYRIMNVIGWPVAAAATPGRPD
ncbi:MAG: DUF2235 domain-containing protein [Acidobacteriaceae bacterium]|nr:DUF2235 domain-containing protein [Acidobacteriaceae bacterium]